MKAVYAYIKKSKFDDVSMALYAMEEVSGVTVIDARGWGRSGEATEQHQYLGRLEENVKLEIVCPDQVAEAVVDAIRRSAHTGVRGDGLVYILPVDSAGRISGERRREGR